MEILKDVSEMKRFSAAARKAGETIVLVPTMGCLHQGHRELLRLGAASASILVLSIFVNPAQFGVNEDFSRYPRDLARDLDMAREEGVDAVFTPDAADMYPDGYRTYVNVEKLGDKLCGISRPGHFRGVATIVLKLFNIVSPHKAVFGKKDFQQLQVIKKMTTDLNLPVEIIEAATVREDDGLAMSSRNLYLSADQRSAAATIPRALNAALKAYREGERKVEALIERACSVIGAEDLAEIDYVKVVDPETMDDLEEVKGPALIAVAVRFGSARLIDNVELVPPARL